MRSSTVQILITATALCIFSACGSGSNGSGGDGDGGGDDASVATVTSLEVTPAMAVLEAVDETAVQQSFTVMASLSDGTTVDVSESASLTTNDIIYGRFDKNVFTTSNIAGGQATVTASYQGVTAQATLIVRLRRNSIVDPAPAQAADLFAAATEDPAMTPDIVYPADNVMVPPNVGEFDVHWRDSAGHDLFEIAITSEYIDIRTYVTGTPNDGSWITLDPRLWSIAGNSQRGGAITVTLSSLASAAPQSKGSASITTYITEEEVEGGIYYWASRSMNRPAGIYRHDMGRPGTEAEQFYTTEESSGNRCVACHALSRDGTRMAVTFDDGTNPSIATVLDVATRTPLVPPDGRLEWNFASFTADGNRVLAVHRGVLTLYNVVDGEVLARVPTNGYATHPDISPLGDAIVYVRPADRNSDWAFGRGSIVVQPFDAATNTFGEARILVQGGAGNGDTVNNYYPSWSPDGQWILFNRSTANAFDEATAELYVIRADGTAPPIRLDSPNVGVGITNSWARWAPFEQRFGANDEPLVWFTFSSKRDFGVRLVNNVLPQIWMAPFFPTRAMAGQDPSAPAFRLPAQNLDSNNHIAQWTEKVVQIE